MSIARPVSPFSDYDAGDVHWVQPILVGEVAHQAAAPAFLEGAHRRESEADRASPGQCWAAPNPAGTRGHFSRSSPLTPSALPMTAFCTTRSTTSGTTGQHAQDHHRPQRHGVNMAQPGRTDWHQQDATVRLWDTDTG